MTSNVWAAGVASPTNGTTAVSVTLPSTVQGGDCMLLAIEWNNGGTGVTCTAPTGWTSNGTITAGSDSTAFYQKVAAGAAGSASSDASTAVTATLSAAKAWGAAVVGYRGVNTTTPVITAATRAETTSGTTHAVPQVNVTPAGCWLVTFVTERASSASFTAPSGFVTRGTYTDVGAASSPVTLQVADSNGPVSTGTTAVGVWTGSATATANAVTGLFAIQPVAGAVNNPPTANAGGDQQVLPYQLVTCVGTGTDTDGTISSYSWSQVSGPTVTLAGSNGSNVTFTAPAALAGATVVLGLTVTDNLGSTSSQDQVTITVAPHDEFYLNPAGTWVPVQIVRL
jgi:hypothetical protein